MDRTQFKTEFIEKVSQVFDNMIEQGFEDRQEQLCAAIYIAESVFNNEKILIEAGVGTGKTFAYLVPSIFKNRDSYKPIIVSTNTIILQDQLVNKDIPILSDIMKIKLDYMAAKGKENYLCIERAKYFGSVYGKIKDLIDAGKFDRSDYQNTNDATWGQICVPDDCQPNECSEISSCGFLQYRQDFLNVKNILVCNHNLFFADLVRRINDEKPLLPDYCSIIFDEAHTLELIAQKSFGRQLNFGRALKILDFCREFVPLGLVKPAIHQLNDIRKSLVFNSDPEALRLGIKPDSDTLKKCGTLSNYLHKIINQLEIASEFEQKKCRKIKRINNYLEEIQFVINCIFTQSDHIIWAESTPNLNSQQLSIWTTPKNINERLKKDLFSKQIPMILSSATLTSNGSFNYIANNLGVSGYRCKAVPSPFDYQSNCLVYIANDLPEFTNDDQQIDGLGYYQKMAGRIREILFITNGRALIHFTSHESLKITFDLLKQDFPWKLLIQSTSSKERLIQAFKTDINSVLLGTGFWEGVDVPGEALSCVVITKLPFPPLDPLLKNKIDNAQKQGKDPFIEVTFPEMLLKLKQGAGRLIRTNADYGIIAILDTRIITKAYKNQALELFKGIPITYELSEIKKFMSSKVLKSSSR